MLLVKLDRFERLLTTKVEEVSRFSNMLSDQTKELSLEIEELKSTRSSFKAEMEKTLKNQMEALKNPLSQDLSNSFVNKTEDFINEHLNILKKIQWETNDTICGITNLVRSSKKSQILRSIYLCVVCFLTASGFFYFFPQHYHVRYENGIEQGKQMLYGKALIDNIKKLSYDDQNLLISYLEDMLKRTTVARTKF